MEYLLIYEYNDPDKVTDRMTFQSIPAVLDYIEEERVDPVAVYKIYNECTITHNMEPRYDILDYS